jgi:ABC-type amino acid transport substrate-binding protein
MEDDEKVARRFRRGLGLSWRGLALLALLAAPAGAESETKPLRLVSDAWPPFTDVAEKPRFAADLVEEALKRSGIQATTSIVGWGEVMTRIGEGRADGSAALWRSPEREAILLYSEPYLENRLVLVGRKGSDVSARSLKDLAGKRIALVEGYAYGEVLDSATEVKLSKQPSDQASLEALLRGDVDYMLVDDLLIRYVLTYQEAEAKAALAIGDWPIASRTLHFALRKELPEAAAIVQGFNAAIKRMQADGSYGRILQLNWISADVDGDGRPELVLQGGSAGETAPSAAYSVTVYATPPATVNRYYVDGKVYEEWNDIPARYKEPGGPKDTMGQSARLFSFKF